MINLLEQQIETAAGLIRQAKQAVVMTGAGFSTPSGVPDFRSPSSGLWQTTDPMRVASIFSFHENPQHFYDWIRPLSALILKAQPNPAHEALAALERAGKIKVVITQNIDDLHGKAGSQTVVELHGHLRNVTCMRCHAVEDATPIIHKFIDDGQVPHHNCGGVFKPNVTLFGEQLPVREYLTAEQAVKMADLVIAAGSSLEVAPASDLPSLAVANQAKIIIINYEPTYLDPQATLIIRADVAEVLPRIAELVIA